jgi:uncharacterized protein
MPPTSAAPFERIARAVSARPRLCVAVVLALTLPFAVALPRLEIRTDGSALYPSPSPEVERLEWERRRFDDPEALVLVVAARPGGDGVLTPAGLAYLEFVTAEVAAVPGVRSDEVLSLANAPDLTESAGTLRLTRMLDPLPRTAAEVERLRDRVRRDGLLEGFLLARDGRSAAILVPLSERTRGGEVVDRLRARARALARPGYDLLLSGATAAETLLGEQILADLRRLVPAVVGVIAVALLIFLRSLPHTLIVLSQMGLVLVWTFGAMALLRVPLTLVTSVLPVLLLAMAVTESMHLLERYQSLRQAGAASADAVVRALADVGPPIARAALTTALGFLSFLTASVPAMRDFGVFAALGLLFALALSSTWVPAGLALAGGRAPAARTPRAHAVGGLETWAAARPRLAATLGLALVFAAAAGIPRLRTQDSWIANFPPQSDVVVASTLLDRQYSGIYRLDVTLESDADGGLGGAAGRDRIAALQAELARLPGVVATRSWLDDARAGLRATSARDLQALDDAGLAQLRLLLELSGATASLRRTLTPSAREARILCFVRDADYARARRLVAQAESAIVRVDAANAHRIHVSGDLVAATAAVRATVGNQVRSVLFTLAALGLFLAWSFRSWATGFVLTAPVAAATLVMFGVMGHLGVALGVATSMYAALVAGEGVDFAIHLVARHDLERRRGRAAPEALQAALTGVGAAIRSTALALIAGCLVLCFSTIQPVRALGGLLSAGLATSWVVAYLFLPALLTWRARRGASTARAISAAVLTGVAAAVLLAATAGTSRAEATRDAGDDADARRIMTAIERAHRHGHRMFAMDSEYRVASEPAVTFRMLGVVDGGAALTRVLHAITGPSLFRGTALVIRDSVDARRRDHMELALPGLDTYRPVETSGFGVLVPGTCLAYEDARGWLAPERYRFRTVSRGRDSVVIEARPRTEADALRLALARLVLLVDRRRLVVLRAHAYDAAGNRTRTYDVEALEPFGARWLPARVRTRHVAQRAEALLTFRYAPLAAAPPDSLFRPGARAIVFLERLLEWRERQGLAARFPDAPPRR